MISQKKPANAGGKLKDPRTLAALILTRIFKEGVSLDRLIPDMIGTQSSDRDRAFARELCYGVLRWYPRLDVIAAGLLSKPLKQKDLDVRAAILCGLYQLEYLRTPQHAAVSASVDVAAQLGKPWAGPVINAVLRRYQRERELLQQAADGTEAGKYAHPQWLISALRADWPQDWRDILQAANERPPMQLRVNTLRLSRSDYLRELARSHIDAHASSLLPAGITLATAVDVDALPGFRDGLVSVQDYGAQLAAAILDVHPGQAVLDACAAPGGKTAHIHECCPGIRRLTALDVNAARVALLHATRQRLDIPMEVIEGDARTPEMWWDGELYDRILLDVPCSATGVIRRHPDIKVLRRPADIAAFAHTQAQLLAALWPLLKAGGRLVYATCSLLALENDVQLQAFSDNRADARVGTIQPTPPWGVASRYGRHTLPGRDAMDGFFYAILEKS